MTTRTNLVIAFFNLLHFLRIKMLLNCKLLFVTNEYFELSKLLSTVK